MNLSTVLSGLPKSTITCLRGVSTTSAITILIPYKPVAKGRPRYTRQGRCYTPKATLEAEQVVKAVALTQIGKKLMQGSLAIELLAICPIPVSWSKKKQRSALAGEIRPASKPDFDNLLKLYCDALNGLLWEDDKQVVDGRCIKCYGEKPAVIIWCWPI